jgi:ADP-heptose:LPS heptosyltransferase
MRILTFADMGIGNFVFYLPVLRALAKEDLTVICPNEQLRAILEYNIKAKYEITNFLTKGRYNVSVNNFLCQDKRHLQKIWKIPQRIGHVAWWRKRSMIFTDKVPMNQDKSEEYYNCQLLEPLGLEPIFEKIKFPDFNMPSYDILISPHSANPEKNWNMSQLLPWLKDYNVKILDSKEPPLIAVCDMISRCKLFIGNDSGLTKIAANLGVKTIQIFRWFTDCFVRSRVKGINLIEPTLEELLCQLNLE